MEIFLLVDYTSFGISHILNLQYFIIHCKNFENKQNL